MPNLEHVWRLSHIYGRECRQIMAQVGRQSSSGPERPRRRKSALEFSNFSVPRAKAGALTSGALANEKQSRERDLTDAPCDGSGDRDLRRSRQKRRHRPQQGRGEERRASGVRMSVNRRGAAATPPADAPSCVARQGWHTDNRLARASRSSMWSCSRRPVSTPCRPHWSKCTSGPIGKRSRQPAVSSSGCAW